MSQGEVCIDSTEQGQDKPPAIPGLDPRQSESFALVRIESSRGWVSLGLRELWHYRELIYFFIWRDIKVRYKQTILGGLVGDPSAVLHHADLQRFLRTLGKNSFRRGSLSTIRLRCSCPLAVFRQRTQPEFDEPGSKLQPGRKRSISRAWPCRSRRFYRELSTFCWRLRCSSR